MAEQWKAQTFDITKINGGVRYQNSDGINANAINAPLEAAAWVQALATNQPDTTNANVVGTPKVSIQTIANGTPQLKFENLKGEKGQDGKDHSTEIANLDNRKLDKVTNPSTLYGVNSAGAQHNFNVAIDNPLGGSVARRDDSGRLYSATPTITGANSQVTNKKYVDDLHSEQEKKIKTLQNVLVEDGTAYIAIEEDKYEQRLTANGENIFDEQFTPISLIKGETVRSINLFNWNAVKTNPNVENGTYSYYGKYGIDLQGNKDTEFPYTVLSTNGVFTPQNTLPVCKSSEVKISFDLTLLKQESQYEESYLFHPHIRLDFPTSQNVFTPEVQNKANVTTHYEFFVNGVIGEQPQFQIYLTSLSLRIENIMVTYGEDLPEDFVPYFNGLKKANIQSIKSTGQNFLNLDEGLNSNFVKNSDGSYTLTKTSTTNRFSSDIHYLLKKGTTYYLQADIFENTTNYNVQIQYFYTDGTESTVPATAENYPYTAKKDISVWRFFISSDDNNGSYIRFKVKFSLANNATQYDYKNDNFILTNAIELGKWDTFNPQNGTIVRKSNTLILTGNEDWAVESVSGSYYTGKNFYINTALTPTPYLYNDIVCSHYTSSRTSSINVANNAFISGSNKLNITASGYGGLAAWTQYLKDQYAAGNPVTVEYETVVSTTTYVDTPKGYIAWANGTETVIQGENDNGEYGAIATISQTYLAKI